MKTVIALKLSKDSENRLENYLGQFGGLLHSKGEFHSTTYFSRENHPLIDAESTEYICSNLPIKLNPENYRLNVFGRNELVLLYEEQSVKEMESFLRKRFGNKKFSAKNTLCLILM